MAVVVDIDKVMNYIGAGDEDKPFVTDCLDQATQMVLDATTTAYKPIPDDIMVRMIIEVTAEMFNRKSTVSGTSQYAVYDGGSVPVLAPRDPLQKIRPMLSVYVMPL